VPVLGPVEVPSAQAPVSAHHPQVETAVHDAQSVYSAQSVAATGVGNCSTSSATEATHHHILRAEVVVTAMPHLRDREMKWTIVDGLKLLLN
jgi:hypothetical protein